MSIQITLKIVTSDLLTPERAAPHVEAFVDRDIKALCCSFLAIFRLLDGLWGLFFACTSLFGFRLHFGVIIAVLAFRVRLGC